MSKNNTFIRVAIAIVLAITAGWISGPDSKLFGVEVVKIYSFIGQLFLNALNLIVVPLVAASVITGIGNMGKEPHFKSLGAKTFGFYALTIATAALVGLIGFFLLSPSGALSTTASSPIDTIAIAAQGSIFDKICEIFFRLIPSNIIAAASQGQMLGIVFFGILFGFFMSKTESKAVIGFWKGVFDIMMKIAHLLMKALPIGVFGLIAKVVAVTGFDAISHIGMYAITVIASYLVYTLVILPLLLMGIAKVNPVRFFKCMTPAILTAFSTTSSVATLPITLDCLEKRAKVSNRICSFSIPLGTSFNMSGVSLYLCVTSLFIAHVYGVDLSAGTIILITLMSCLTSIGVAGIPSASLISLIIILHAIGVPAEGVGLIMAVERILDMFRTTVNVLANATCAVLIGVAEGEKSILAKD